MKSNNKDYNYLNSIKVFQTRNFLKHTQQRKILRYQAIKKITSPNIFYFSLNKLIFLELKAMYFSVSYSFSKLF